MASTPHPTYFPRRLARRLLPRSLTGRVYALYSITLVAFVGLGLALFLLHYFKQEIEDTQQASVMLVEVVAQAVQDSAVIGDYDTLRKTLEKTVNGPLYASATFMDVGGGRVHVENRMVGQTEPPQWLLRWANNRLYDVNHTVSVGGKDYGVLRLQFDVAHVAEDLWLVSRVAVGLGLLSLLTGLLVIRFPLLRWLGSMEQLRHLLSRLGNSDFDANRIDLQDAPSEVRRVVEMVEQTATLLREREASRRALDERNYAMDQHAIVSVTDLQGSILYANDRFSAISGYSSEELMGKNHRIIKSGLHDPAFYVDLWQTISSGRVWHGEICNRKRAGDYYWVDATVVPLMGPDGLPSQYIAIRTDITDRKNIELSLEAARDVAEQASLAKGQFLANMSHELRTPMNAILGLLKLLQATALNDQQIKYTHQTEGAARSLLSLLNDILDFSKIEAGKMALDPHPFLIDQLLRDLSVILSASVTEKDLDVLFDIDSQVPRHLVGDAMRLQQVLINLGSNAIKFTSQGQVVVRLRVVERDAQGVLIEFAVQDSGIGIAPEHQVHIFTGFSQAEASTTRRFGGTGLGLAICRRLVALMGGVLQVESSQGIGSTFSFTVRLELGAQENIAISLKPAAALHALVVDDNAASRELMAGMAHSLGWSVDLADSGASALAMVQQSLAEGKPYEVVFVDWKMPGMDGWETSERMRALLANRSMILMVSAHGRDMLGQRSASERARLDGFLVKPVTASMLYDGVMEARAAMAQAASGMAQAAAAEPAAKPKRLDGLRLLVVEDNKINQLVAKGLLGQEGAVVTLADNGQLGVQALSDAPEYFDLVLMDVQMPVMDGFEATRIIRQTLALADLPVIAMTANAMASDREACLAAGMNDHVGKPFEIDHLVATVLHYVARDIA